MLQELSRREALFALAATYMFYPRETQPMTKIRPTTDYLVVHGAFTYPDMDTDAKTIDRWHRKRGFSSIGYHAVIRRDGTVEQGRQDNLIGAGVYGYNDVSWHVCLIGGKSRKTDQWENNYTNAQFRSLIALLRKKGMEYPDAIIMGHRDFPRVESECPGFNLTDWLG